MEHLNFCRQVTRQFTERLQIPSLEKVVRARMAHALDLTSASQKFMLPDGGILLDDPELRAIDDTMPLRLPHKYIALEFIFARDETRAHLKEKHILLARERDEFIFVSACICYHHDDRWVWLPECTILRTDYLIRDNKSGNAGVRFRPLFADDVEDLSEYHLYLHVLMCFLNALQCSNVYIERNPSRKNNKKAKDPLPFDSYHVLNIDVPKRTGTIDPGPSGIVHRSPREHLRRGHIVRPHGRKPFWRNASIVNAASGGGRIEKDYNVRSQPKQLAAA